MLALGFDDEADVLADTFGAVFAGTGVGFVAVLDVVASAGGGEALDISDIRDATGFFCCMS
jgi:hypothetical protein